MTEADLGSTAFLRSRTCLLAPLASGALSGAGDRRSHANSVAESRIYGEHVPREPWRPKRVADSLYP